MIVGIFLSAILIFFAVRKLNSDWPGLILPSRGEKYFSGKKEPFSKARVAHLLQGFDCPRRATAQLEPGGWRTEQENGCGPPWYVYTEGGQSKTTIRGSEMYETIFASIGKR